MLNPEKYTPFPTGTGANQDDEIVEVDFKASPSITNIPHVSHSSGGEDVDSELYNEISSPTISSLRDGDV